MMILFKCDCGKGYKLDDKFAGRKVKCKGCGKVIVVPNLVVDGLEIEPQEPMSTPPPAVTPKPKRRWRKLKITAMAFLVSFASLFIASAIDVIRDPRGTEKETASTQNTDVRKTYQQTKQSQPKKPSTKEKLVFQVMNITHNPHLDKTSFDVRLSRPISERELAKLGKSLRKKHGQNAKRVFICYYLPGMQVNAGAWAVTHYRPILDPGPRAEVRIIGN